MLARARPVLVLLVVVLVFVGLAAYGDFREVGYRIAHFPVPYLLVALGLAGLNYALRFLRGAYYLRVLGVHVPGRLSLLVFMSGLALSVTPGKVGELLKCYILKQRAGVPASTSASAVVMERLTDVFAVVLVGLTGLALLPGSAQWALAGVLALCVGSVLFLVSAKSHQLFKLPLLRRWSKHLELSQEGFKELSQPRPLVLATVLGTLAWLSEGVALFVVLRGLAVDVQLLWALPIYASATIVGALTALPGGLVGTEGTMLALLQQVGVERGAASAGVLLVRLATLWFAVGIGLAALGYLYRFRTTPLAAAEAE